MIRIATIEDIDTILDITKQCTKYMIDKAIFQWNEQYPNKSAFEEDVKSNELYVLEIKNEIIGCIVVSNFMDEEYFPIKWLTPNSNNIYIHRLAVHPAQQGNGNAQKLMDFAEKWAKENDYISIRLDTFSQNSRNIAFYEQRNYKRLGSIYFPKQSDHPFYCYELIL